MTVLMTWFPRLRRCIRHDFGYFHDFEACLCKCLLQKCETYLRAHPLNHGSRYRGITLRAVWNQRIENRLNPNAPNWWVVILPPISQCLLPRSVFKLSPRQSPRVAKPRWTISPTSFCCRLFIAVFLDCSGWIYPLFALHLLSPAVESLRVLAAPLA